MSRQFTQTEIENMRTLRKQGKSQYVIANVFGVPSTSIYQYIKDITPEGKVDRLPRTALTAQMKQTITNMYAQKFTVDQIARFLGVTDATIMNFVNKNKDQ